MFVFLMCSAHTQTDFIVCVSQPCGEGYLAVLLPGLKWFDREMLQLKSEEEYKEVLARRAADKKMTT